MVAAMKGGEGMWGGFLDLFLTFAYDPGNRDAVTGLRRDLVILARGERRIAPYKREDAVQGVLLKLVEPPTRGRAWSHLQNEAQAILFRLVEDHPDLARVFGGGDFIENEYAEATAILAGYLRTMLRRAAPPGPPESVPPEPCPPPEPDVLDLLHRPRLLGPQALKEIAARLLAELDPVVKRLRGHRPRRPAQTLREIVYRRLGLPMETEMSVDEKARNIHQRRYRLRRKMLDMIVQGESDGTIPREQAERYRDLMRALFDPRGRGGNS